MKHPVPALGLSLLMLTGSLMAQPPEQPDNLTDVITLIEQVTEDMGREVVIDPRIRGIQVIITRDDVDYDGLLGALRINNLVAIEIGDQIHVMPEQNMRSQATRILQEDDPNVSDHEVVTRIIQVPEVGEVTRTNEQGETFTEPELAATRLVPVLRPMMSQAAQLAAVPGTNTLILVDRYDNIRRLTAVIDELVEALDD
jgi:general secretion pathway protein D